MITFTANVLLNFTTKESGSRFDKVKKLENLVANFFMDHRVQLNSVTCKPQLSDL